jgi:hypothetical protein
MDKICLETYLKNDACSIYEILMNHLKPRLEKQFY